MDSSDSKDKQNLQIKKHTDETKPSLPAKTEGSFELYSDINYKSLFDNHPDIVFSINRLGEILEVNERVKLIGYQPKEVKGLFTNFIAAEEIEKNLHKFKNELKGFSENYDTILRKKDGSPLEVNVTSIPIKTDGNVIGVFGIAKDISELKSKEKALESIRNSLDLAQLTANIGSWDFEPSTMRLFWSKQLFKILGIENTHNYVPTIENYLQFIHPNDYDWYFKRITTAFHNKQNYEAEYQITRSDGKERYVYEKANAICNEQGKLIRFIGIIQDITEKKQAEQRFKENELRLKLLYDNLDVGIWLLNLRNKQFQYISAGIQNICGFTPEDFYENSFFWDKIVHPDDLSAYISYRDTLLKGNSSSFQYRIIHRDGTIHWVNDHTFPKSNQNGEIVTLYGIIGDITAQKKAEEQLAFLAHHDYLTKLPNRRYFDHRLTNLIADSNHAKDKFAVFYFDLDRFKHINDSFGHLIGDELLKEVTARLSPLITDNNLLARMGGDEFAIIVSDFDSNEQLTEMAKQIISNIKNPFTIDDFELYVTTSIGISVFPQDGTTSKTLIKNADAALYRAKELGKDNYQFYLPKDGDKTINTCITEKDLHRALSNNEFRVYYQPCIDVKTKKISGAEALIRWEHPERGLILPGKFISLAEESGLIVQIGEWMIRNVCQQLQSWEQEGKKKVPISINISTKSLLKNNWSQSLLQIIKETGIDPKFLEFEITENTILQDDEIVHKSIDSIRELGIKIFLDDFGTGFSSITNLKQFLFDYIKIDRSFVQNMKEDSLDALLTESIIDLSHRLKMKVVAEGVETIEQLELLDKYGCDNVQGFLFSRPVEVNQLEELLSKDKIDPKDYLNEGN